MILRIRHRARLKPAIKHLSNTRVRPFHSSSKRQIIDIMAMQISDFLTRLLLQVRRRLR